MKVEDYLSKDTKSKLKKMRKRRKKRKKPGDPFKEKLSERDLKDLMGLNRDTYSRGKGGAIRRK
jgi:hypothetical protein